MRGPLLLLSEINGTNQGINSIENTEVKLLGGKVFENATVVMDAKRKQVDKKTYTHID